MNILDLILPYPERCSEMIYKNIFFWLQRADFLTSKYQELDETSYLYIGKKMQCIGTISYGKINNDA